MNDKANESLQVKVITEQQEKGGQGEIPMASDYYLLQHDQALRKTSAVTKKNVYHVISVAKQRRPLVVLSHYGAFLLKH